MNSLVLAVLDARPSTGEATSYLLVGFGVVMLTLLALAIVCSLVGSLFRRFPALAGKAPESSVKVRRPSRAAQSIQAATVDTALLAAIGAAVDQTLGGRYRIKSVTPVGKE